VKRNKGLSRIRVWECQRSPFVFITSRMIRRILFNFRECRAKCHASVFSVSRAIVINCEQVQHMRTWQPCDSDKKGEAKEASGNCGAIVEVNNLLYIYYLLFYLHEINRLAVQWLHDNSRIILLCDIYKFFLLFNIFSDTYVYMYIMFLQY